MEHRQSSEGNHYYQGAIQGIRTQAARLAGLKTKLQEDAKEQRVCHHCQSETLLIIQNGRPKANGTPFKIGRDSMSKANTIPPATSRGTLLSTAPIPTPNNISRMGPRQNAVAGPSRNRTDQGVLAGSRKALMGEEEGDGDDFIIQHNPGEYLCRSVVYCLIMTGMSIRGSASPKKAAQTTLPSHSTRASETRPTRSGDRSDAPRRTDNTHQSGWELGISGPWSRKPPPPPGRSVSPQKGKQKATPQRPRHIKETDEVHETIENPDEPFRDDGFQIMEGPPKLPSPPTAMAERTRSGKQSTGSKSPTKSAAAEKVDPKGKGKALASRTHVDLHEWNSSTGDEAEIHAVQAPPIARQGIPSSNLGGDAMICKTAVVWCVDSEKDTRNMRVWQVQLHGDGITLGDPKARQSEFVYIGLPNILETHVRQAGSICKSC